MSVSSFVSADATTGWQEVILSIEEQRQFYGSDEIEFPLLIVTEE